MNIVENEKGRKFTYYKHNRYEWYIIPFRNKKQTYGIDSERIKGYHATSPEENLRLKRILEHEPLESYLITVYELESLFKNGLGLDKKPCRGTKKTYKKMHSSNSIIIKRYGASRRTGCFNSPNDMQNILIYDPKDII
jgi:hypothetical protein